MIFRPHDEFTLRLAVFLKTADTPSIPKQELLQESERLLLKLCELYPTSGTVNVELADLYYKCEKYASALGYLLRAKLNGYSIESEIVVDYQKRLRNEPLDLHEDAHGAYLLGGALVESGEQEKGLYFLEQAVRHGKNQCWQSFAALDLADACRGIDNELMIEALKLASDLGNPEILRAPHKQPSCR